MSSSKPNAAPGIRRSRLPLLAHVAGDRGDGATDAVAGEAGIAQMSHKFHELSGEVYVDAENVKPAKDTPN
jgi:hypothetical protein